MDVSVVGLGKLGAPLAAVLASKGHRVVGLDTNEVAVQRMNDGQAPVAEPRLQELIDAGRGRLRATTSYDEAIAGTEVTFVLVPTPSDRSGSFTNRHVLAAIEQIGHVLRRKQGYHLVVVTSTVMPGSTGDEIRPVLERSSGRAVGDDLGLCYNPEFIALGSVIADMLAPDFLLIGESDQHAGDVLERIYSSVCENRPPVRRMNFVNAELTKLSVNTFVTTKISYANTLANLCERLPGADVDVVTAALGCDSRIGAKYLKGALGYGGPCFPRDNIAFAALGRLLGAPCDLAEATDRINRYQIERLVGAVEGNLAPGGTVGVLGLSYKPDTDVIEESQGVGLARRLAEQGYRVVVYDPLAAASARAVLGSLVEVAESAADCARAADVAVITTPWPEFRRLSLETLGRDGRQLTVIDCWRILPKDTIPPSVRIRHLGSGGRKDELAAAADHVAGAAD